MLRESVDKETIDFIMIRETVDKETIDFSMLRIKEPLEITLLRNCRQIPLTLTFRLKEFPGAMFLYFLQTAP